MTPTRGSCARAALLLAATALLSGCAGDATTDPPADAPSATSIVVLGDSLSAAEPHDCPGCTSFIDLYAADLGDRDGADPIVHDDAVDDSQIADLTAHLDDPGVTSDLATADLVVVWIGYNEGPPWNADTPCGTAPGDTADEQASAIESYTTDCIDATLDLYAGVYSDLFARIASLSPDAHARFALTVFDNLADNPSFPAPEFSGERMSALLDRVVPIFDTWNANLCGSAESNDFRCVDVYHDANGPDGMRPMTGYVAVDFTHLSQAGHDAVGRLLIDASEGA